jgi:putative endonuclease
LMLVPAPPLLGTTMRHVYILRCSDRSLYVGSTTDLPSRLRAHNEGNGARYTSTRRPMILEYSESLPDQTSAIRRERQLKGWSRSKKEVLIAGDLERLRELSRGRS